MIVPKHHYYNGYTSDRDKIEYYMSYVPQEFKQKVADRFDNMMLKTSDKNRRKRARKYLHTTAMNYLNNGKENESTTRKI